MQAQTNLITLCAVVVVRLREEDAEGIQEVGKLWQIEKSDM